MKNGVDFLVVVLIGSGKIISFLLLIFNNIMRRRVEEKVYGIYEFEVIVVVLMRELVY